MKLLITIYLCLSFSFVTSVKAQNTNEVIDFLSKKQIKYTLIEIDTVVNERKIELTYPHIIAPKFGTENTLINLKLKGLFEEKILSNKIKNQIHQISKSAIADEMREYEMQEHQQKKELVADEIKTNVTGVYSHVKYYFKNIIGIGIYYYFEAYYNANYKAGWKNYSAHELSIEEYYFIDLNTLKEYSLKDLIKPTKLTNFNQFIEGKAKEFLDKETQRWFVNGKYSIENEYDESLEESKTISKDSFMKSIDFKIDIDNLAFKIDPFLCNFSYFVYPKLQLFEKNGILIKLNFNFLELVPFLNEKGGLKSMILFQKKIKTKLKNTFLFKNKELYLNSKQKYIDFVTGLPPNISTKSIKTISFIDGNNLQEKNVYGKVHFSRNNAVTKIEYFKSERLASTIKFKYDKSYNMIQKINTSKYEIGNTTDYQYDKNNNLIKVVEKSGYGEKRETNFIYLDTVVYSFVSDAENETIVLNSYGDIISHFYFYSEPYYVKYYEQRKLKKISYRNDQLKSGVFDYYNNGLLKKFRSKNLKRTIVYQYNSYNGIKKQKELVHDLNITNSFFYNDKHLIIKSVSSSKGLVYSAGSGGRFNCIRTPPGKYETNKTTTILYKYTYW